VYTWVERGTVRLISVSFLRTQHYVLGEDHSIRIRALETNHETTAPPFDDHGLITNVLILNNPNLRITVQLQYCFF